MKYLVCPSAQGCRMNKCDRHVPLVEMLSTSHEDTNH